MTTGSYITSLNSSDVHIVALLLVTACCETSAVLLCNYYAPDATAADLTQRLCSVVSMLASMKKLWDRVGPNCPRDVDSRYVYAVPRRWLSHGRRVPP